MITISHLSKTYESAGVSTVALTNISFTIKKGEFVAIMGPSGSGKSTLMHILGLLDTPTSGTYTLDGQEIRSLSDDDLARIRNRQIGFVFQAYNLLPRTTALGNVMLPMMYAGIPKEERQKRAVKLLGDVGLSDRMGHRSQELSGGQQQRVAIARALAMNPGVILADEPTGNLSTVQSQEIMYIFSNLHKDGHTIVMITHEPYIAKYAKRILYLRDGSLVRDQSQGSKRRHRA